MALNHSPSIVTANLIMCLDFANPKCYNGDVSNGSTVRDMISLKPFTMSNANGYASANNGTIQWTRANTSQKDGAGLLLTGANNASGPLTSVNFIYNNHTWEVWVRIDDILPGSTQSGYDITEGASDVSLYSGYHSGFSYDAFSMYYTFWDSANTAAINIVVGSVGTTNAASIVQNSWCQIVATNNNSTVTTYINGQPTNVSYRPSLRPGNTGLVTNQLTLGKTANLGANTGAYLTYAKNTISNMKMYNRALSNTEISQNFNAIRKRFGL